VQFSYPETTIYKQTTSMTMNEPEHICYFPTRLSQPLPFPTTLSCLSPWIISKFSVLVPDNPERNPKWFPIIRAYIFILPSPPSPSLPQQHCNAHFLPAHQSASHVITYSLPRLPLPQAHLPRKDHQIGPIKMMMVLKIE
jgi:hypothetical protein